MKKQHLKIVGHRGAAGLAEENTIASIRSALQYRVDIVEVDIRLSKDGIVVLSHDASVTTPAGNHIAIASASYADLMAVHATITTLEQAIDYIDHRAKLMLDIKDPAAWRAVVGVVRARLKQGWKPGEFTIASRNYHVLRDVRTALPALPLVIIESWSAVRASRRARALGTPYISMNQMFLWWGVVHVLSRHFKLYSYPYAHRFPGRHTRPNGWTPNGLYGIITDRPDYFRTPK